MLTEAEIITDRHRDRKLQQCACESQNDTVVLESSFPDFKFDHL